MITRQQFSLAQQRGMDLLRRCGVFIKDEEFGMIDVADFGLGDLEHFGAQILTLVNTEQIAVKLIAMTPFQILPEHWHPKIGEYQGKEEILRVAWGQLLMYSPGEPTPQPRARVPADRKKYFSHCHQTIMLPGDQIHFAPGVPHWFQGGPEGAVVWSFSTKVLDLQDEFTDPEIQRQTIIRDVE